MGEGVVCGVGENVACSRCGNVDLLYGELCGPCFDASQVDHEARFVYEGLSMGCPICTGGAS